MGKSRALTEEKSLIIEEIKDWGKDDKINQVAIDGAVKTAEIIIDQIAGYLDRNGSTELSEQAFKSVFRVILEYIAETYFNTPYKPMTEDLAKAVAGVLIKVIKELDGVNIGHFKISAHLIEQTLKEDRIQLGLFDPIRREDIQSIENKSSIDGIDLTASEHKIIYAICKLLHNKSQTKDPTREDYYTGDAGALMVSSKSIEAPGEKVPAPRIYCTLYEITREYSGGGNPSGKQIENVESILTDLKEKNFRFTYKQTIKKKGKTIERAITGERALLHIDLATEKVGKEETLREKIITLEPIFRNQIESKFLLYPQDHIKRIEEAWGSKKAPSIVYSMVDYLNQIRSGKQPKGRSAGEIRHSIYVSNLYKKIDPKTLDKGRKTRLKTNIEKALDLCKQIKLLVDYEIGTGKTGEKMYIFYINKEWE
jgi:hypothetical protein